MIPDIGLPLQFQLHTITYRWQIGIFGRCISNLILFELLIENVFQSSFHTFRSSILCCYNLEKKGFHWIQPQKTPAFGFELSRSIIEIRHFIIYLPQICSYQWGFSSLSPLFDILYSYFQEAYYYMSIQCQTYNNIESWPKFVRSTMTKSPIRREIRECEATLTHTSTQSTRCDSL